MSCNVPRAAWREAFAPPAPVRAREILGVHFYKSFAPVAKLQSFRALLSEAARRGMNITYLDIRSAYLKARCPVKKWMTPPKGVVPPKPGLVWLLHKAIYGLRDSAAAWHETFKKDLCFLGLSIPSTFSTEVLTEFDLFLHHCLWVLSYFTMAE